MKKLISIIVTIAFFSLFMVLDLSIESDSQITINQCKSSMLFSNAIAGDTEIGEEGVVCNCGLIWGKGCKSSNYGNSCWNGNICSNGDINC